MAYDWYDGTSAYKLDQYEEYTKKVTEKQEVNKQKEAFRLTVNRKRLITVLSVVFAVATAFLFANSVLIQTSSKVNDLTRELEDMKVRNTQVSFDIASGVDYSEVEKKAISIYGMQRPESYQNVYVDVEQNDYAELAVKKAESKGVVSNLVSELKAFLAYIK